MALYETNRELGSQRLDLYQANQWADQAREEKISSFGELDMRNRIFQENRAKWLASGPKSVHSYPSMYTRESSSLASLKGGLLWSFLTVHAGVHFHARVSKLASTVMSRFALGLRKPHVSVDSSAAPVRRQRANSVVKCG